MRTAVKTYYQLSKPGIVWGNALAAATGYFIGAYSGVDWPLLIYTVLGLSLVIASACIFNNYADREMDSKMERTKRRALVAGAIPHTHALIFACAAGLVGAALLFYFTNLLALVAALVGFVVYVFLYTPLKSKSSVALYVGAIAGATPPVVGYAAASGALDTTALILFILMFIWQLPHFIAIAIFRFEEYTAASVPLVVTRVHSPRVKKIALQFFVASLLTLPLACVGSAIWRLLLT